MATMMDMTRTDLYEFLKDRDGDQCMFPGCERALEDPKDINTIDHIYPKYLAKADGWDYKKINHVDNLQLMHKTCNAKKGHQLPDENGMFEVKVRQPRVIRTARPEICDTCFSGRILNIGEVCPDCQSGPQPQRWPGSLQRKPKECDHSTFHCWMCVVDDPNLRVDASYRLIAGP